MADLSILGLGDEGFELAPGRIASCSFAGFGQDGSPIIEERALQWWPESLTDDIEVGWTKQQVAGGSHSLNKWGSNGGRTISFEVKLSRVSHPEFGVDLVEDRHNVDVAAAISYLRSYCYPMYSTGVNDGLVVAGPPVTCWFHAPNVRLMENGDDIFEGVMTGCAVTYVKFFPDGTPRMATVSVSLSQTVQSSSGVRWVDGRDMYRGVGSSYNGAGKKVSGMRSIRGVDYNPGSGTKIG